MLKKYYKFLNYIRKNEPITESNLSEKFPDCKEWISKIGNYYDRIDKNELYQSQIEENFHNEAVKLNLNVSETSEYVRNHMPTISSSSDFVFYSVNEKFLEEREKTINKRLLFWLPYSITTIIAIASIISQFLN